MRRRPLNKAKRFNFCCQTFYILLRVFIDFVVNILFCCESLLILLWTFYFVVSFLFCCNNSLSCCGLFILLSTFSFVVNIWGFRDWYVRTLAANGERHKGNRIPYKGWGFPNIELMLIPGRCGRVLEKLCISINRSRNR